MDDSWHMSAPVCGDAAWTKLAELVASDDLLLHGSQTPGLSELTPRAPLDFSHDEFSKRTAIFATEDPTWAIAFAIRSAACQWIIKETGPVVAEVPVTPQNLPMTPRFHDLATVSARARKNPEGFPWVGDSGSLQ